MVSVDPLYMSIFALSLLMAYKYNVKLSDYTSAYMGRRNELFQLLGDKLQLNMD